jgi:hypothetical protein
MIVPQLAWGGCTPMERIESADSVKHVEGHHEREEHNHARRHVGQDLLAQDVPVRRAGRDRGLDELALLQGEDDAANRPRHVGHVDRGDDQDRQ